MSRPRFWHRIRFKLLLVSLTLLGIPLAGYRFIQETEQFLRDAQDQSLQTTASSVANIMHGYDDQFHGVARPGSVLTFRNLYLHRLDEPPQVDGYRDEWVHYANNFSLIRSVDEALTARIFIGTHGRYLYLLLGVRDRQVDYGDDGDAVDLAITDRDGVLQRYRVQPRTPGWVTARRLRDADDPPDAALPDPPIRGEWQSHADGYTLELKMPRELLRDRLSMRVFDSHSQQLLASGHMFPADALGRIIEHSATLQAVLDDVVPAATRVWVTDHQGLVLAQAGRLDASAPLSADQQQMPWFIQELVLAVLPRDAEAVGDVPADRTQLFVRPVVDALAGRPTSLRRKPPRSNAVVVSAAVPIRSSDGVEGAVLVEQTTNAILSIQNLALQRLFGVTLLFFAVTSLGLLGFASLLASRITRLRDRVERAVSHDGRITGRLQAEHSRDEIGDLGRSFASVLDRLHDYNHYLEAMASRLAHELRTPLAVVRSSLDNAEQAPAAQRGRYLGRARDGAERLERILQRLREATGLEQALRQAEPERFDIAALLRRQVDALRTTFADCRIELSGAATAVEIDGVPDLVSQALDKLIGNAIDFHDPGSAIRIHCAPSADRVDIHVTNHGPPLPADVDIFQSMVSGRSGRQEEPHLGLGLYLVRLIGEYHGGGVRATDVADPRGVDVTLSLARRN
ncbi:MAG: ATP-binding protein [Gammaproteobacteria bacterium]|nr:ATP-binding protein [Gammaproteobacteria bacterium]